VVSHIRSGKGKADNSTYNRQSVSGLGQVTSHPEASGAGNRTNCKDVFNFYPDMALVLVREEGCHEEVVFAPKREEDRSGPHYRCA